MRSYVPSTLSLSLDFDIGCGGMYVAVTALYRLEENIRVRTITCTIYPRAPHSHDSGEVYYGVITQHILTCDL